ncbi:hypothetical protein [Sphingobacterium sp. CZ-2]|uniref:hypothetical protein n=1 Tax=Sphingobacterium sp. CZ-2 TaxID=2557994 RepID=UPI001FD659CE|nr:hypothetical protein [Sphingobacterium sp. CZ-2]
MVRLKQVITTICLIWFACFVAQGQSRQERFEAIEKQKSAYITKQLKLTPAEAQRFFPLYNQYTKEIMDVKSQKNKRAADAGNSPRSNNFRGGQDIIEYDAKEVEIKKKYRGKFAEVLDQTRASRFFAIEQEFIKLLYKELDSRNKND